MAMKNHSLLDELTDLVGTRLTESADGNALARDAHYSRFHFQRMFRRQRRDPIVRSWYRRSDLFVKCLISGFTPDWLKI